MRSISRLAVTAAALLVGATVLVASEESVRLARVIEKPEDLAAVFTDAQTSVTYDSATGRFYYPSLGLYFDPVTSLFYDPKTGQYRDQALQGDYYEDCMSGMYYDPLSGHYFDAKRKMSYDPISGAYSDMESGLSLYWDSQLQMFYDPMHDGKYYDRSLGLYLTYDQQKEMFCTEDGKYYDPELGLYYDEEVGLFFDPLQNRYYDRETGEYRDPDTGSITPDAAGHLHPDDATGHYFCDLDGHCYWFDSSLGLYCSIDAPTDSSRLYYDADTTHHIAYNCWMGYYYEVESGNSYDPMTGLYYDGYTGNYYRYDPTTGFYVDDYWGMRYIPYWLSDPMAWSPATPPVDVPINQIDLTSRDRMYNDMMSGCRTDGHCYYYDERTDVVFFFDPCTCLYYDIETGDSYLTPTEATSRQTGAVDVSKMSWDDMYRMYYDSNTGRWYDDTVGLYYDGMSYYDPATGDGYWYDGMSNSYVNSMTGEVWTPKSSSSTGGSDGVDLSNMYFDSMYGMYYDPYNYRWYDDTTGLYYDGMSYFDLQTGDTYWYDMMWNQYVNSRTGEVWAPKTSSSGTGSYGVDMSNMYWDDMYQMYYDWSKGYYYDDKAGLYYDGITYYDPQTWDSYWYDSMSNRYVNYMTGEALTSKSSSGTGNGRGFNLANMVYDDMYGMYYDPSKGYYFDATASLYYDGMSCYYDPLTWRMYYYDSMQDFFYDPMTGERYVPRDAVTGLTQDEIDEIKNEFHLLGELMPYANMQDPWDTMADPVNKTVSLEGAYYVAPFGAADAVWFDQLLADGMNCQARRIRLRASAIPLQLEVEVSDPWSTMPDMFQPANLFVEVSESVWNRATRSVVLTLEPAWCMGGLWNGNGMYYWTMMPMTGIEGVDSQDDFAAYARYAGEGYYENLFSMAVFRGCWSFDCSGMGMMMGGSDCGLPVSSLRTVGGLQDTDGDGLADVDEYRYGTNIFLYDTDGDGLNDALEIRIGSCPTMYDPDSDGDGMADVWEEHFGFNPQNPVDANADPDKDSLINRDECFLGTNPIDDDTDADGLRDGQELKCGTQPCNPDTDNDGLPDGAEVCRCTNPLNPDTDLDGVLDGAEIAAGLNPLSVDSDGDRIADSDELHYELDGMNCSLKWGDELVRRLQNWLPLDVPEVDYDYDMDGVPDYVQYLAGSEPYSGFDVTEGYDGYPAAYVMTLTLDASQSPHPACLDLNGEKICINDRQTFTRWCLDGDMYTLQIVGPQGAMIPVDLSFENCLYANQAVIVEDSEGGLADDCQPADGCPHQHTVRTLRFFQPTVRIVNETICFHGEGENRQMKKTVESEICPDEFEGRIEWTLVEKEKDPEYHVEGTAVNVGRCHVGTHLRCTMISQNGRMMELARSATKRIGSCLHQSLDAVQEEWCEIHNRELSICRDLHIEDCEMCGDRTQVRDMKMWKGTEIGQGPGGPTTNEPTTGNDHADDGEPVFKGTKASYSVALNNDDDNGSKSDDLEKRWYEGEDDLKMLQPVVPWAPECCECKEHLKVESLVPDYDSKGVIPWCDERKYDRWVDPFDPQTPAFIEGVTMSHEPNDAKITWRLRGQEANGETKVLKHDTCFTVYSLRLIPDLNRDQKIDVEDKALVPQMKSSGLGWFVDAEKGHVFRLQSDVGIQGEVVLRIKRTKGNGRVRLETPNLPNASAANRPHVFPRGKQEMFIQITDSEGTACSGSYDFVLYVSQQGTEVEIEAIYKGTSSETTGYECHAQLKAYSPMFRIAGDGDRDGMVKFGDPADTNIVFWINDDYDIVRYNDAKDEKMCQQDDLSSVVDGVSYRNCDDNVIGAVYGKKNENSCKDDKGVVHYCFRDFEDLDRLQVEIDQHVCEMANGRPISLAFRIVPENQQELPSINLFHAIRGDQFYLKGTVEAIGLSDSEKKLVAQTAMIKQLDQSRLVTINSTIGGFDKWQFVQFTKEHQVSVTNCFLYEGKSIGKGRLETRICCGDLVLAQTSLMLDLHTARSLTEVFRVQEDVLNEENGVDEFLMQVGEVRTEPSTASMPGRNDKELALLVLGWNVCPREKDDWNEMFFKRLFWHGYKGRVGSFMWPCLYGQYGKMDVIIDPPHFDRSEHRAWLSAVKAANQFSKIVKDGTHLTLVAHSQGNVLVGEALRRLKPEERSRITYIAMQGAISAQFYTTSRHAPIDNPYGDGEYNMKATGVAATLINEGMKVNERKWGMRVDNDSWDLGMSYCFRGIWTLWGTSPNIECPAPDVFAHYPHGLENEKPYLNNVLKDLRNKANFYNRQDYALNIWLGNNGTRPDNLKGIGPDDRSFGYKKGEFYTFISEGKDVKFDLGEGQRFYQQRNGKKFVIYPGEDRIFKGDEYCFYDADVNNNPDGIHWLGGENAKWCIFSFVVQSRSLAIGQVNLDDVFGKDQSIDLEGKYGFSDIHYDHSHQFRSDIIETWPLWNQIIDEMKK